MKRHYESVNVNNDSSFFFRMACDMKLCLYNYKYGIPIWNYGITNRPGTPPNRTRLDNTLHYWSVNLTLVYLISLSSDRLVSCEWKWFMPDSFTWLCCDIVYMHQGFFFSPNLHLYVLNHLSCLFVFFYSEERAGSVTGFEVKNYGVGEKKKKQVAESGENEE